MMPPLLRSLLTACLLAAPALVPGGCKGTSIEGGNPGVGEFDVDFQGPDGPIPVHGFLSVYVQDAPPRFFTPVPDDGYDAVAEIEIAEGPRPRAKLYVGGVASLRLDTLDLLYHVIDSAYFAMPKRSAAGGARTKDPFIRPLNILVQGVDGKVGTVRGLSWDPDSQKFRSADAPPTQRFLMPVRPGLNYSGTLDTAGLRKPAMALFIPGTPFMARIVRGVEFAFKELPAGKFPLRLVLQDGRLFALDSLPLGPDTALGTLKPGAVLDTLALPDPAPTLDAPFARPSGQFAFTDSVVVELDAASGAEIYYTKDGSAPTTDSSFLYVSAKPIVLHTSTTLRARAFMRGRKPSDISSNTYVLIPHAPAATPRSLAFRGTLVVALTAVEPNAVIYYTLDGSDPAASSLVYAPPGLTLDTTTTLRAVTFVPGMGFSRAIQENYVEIPDTVSAP